MLEIHSIEGETSDVIVNAILNSAENSALRIHLFFSKIKTRNLMMHDSIMAEKEHFFFWVNGPMEHKCAQKFLQWTHSS